MPQQCQTQDHTKRFWQALDLQLDLPWCLPERQREGAESATSHTGKTGLSADAWWVTLLFAVKFHVCFKTKRRQASELP